MIKFFSLFLDLLEIPTSTEYMLLAQSLIDKPESKIISFYSFGFVFSVFQDFLLGKISQEEFLAFGDSCGILSDYQKAPIYTNESLLYGLLNDKNYYADSFIVLAKEDKLYLEKMLPSLLDILKEIKSQIYYL